MNSKILNVHKMKKVIFGDENRDSNILSMLSTSILKTGSTLEEQFKTLSDREKEIANQKSQIDQITTISYEKASKMATFENIIKEKEKSIESEYRNAKAKYYSRSKELSDEEDRQKSAIEELKKQSRLIHQKRAELNDDSFRFQEKVMSISESEEKIKQEHAKITDFIDYLNDSNYINSFSEQFLRQIKETQNGISNVDQEISKIELQLIEMKMNSVSGKTNIANLQKDEISLRLNFIRQEQKLVSYIQNLSAKIKSANLSEIRNRKIKNYFKKKKNKLDIRIPRLKKQIAFVDDNITIHSNDINNCKTSISNAKAEVQYCKQQQIQYKSDIEILNRRFKRRQKILPENLKGIILEKNKVESKLQLQKNELDQKNKTIQLLELQMKKLEHKNNLVNECKIMIKQAFSDFNLKQENEKLSQEIKMHSFHEDVKRLSQLNEQIVEQEQLYHQLTDKFYQIYPKEEIEKPQPFKSKIKPHLIKENQIIKDMKKKIHQTEIDIHNYKRQIHQIQKNLEHLHGINQYLEIHKTICSKENEIEIVERIQKIKRNISELEKDIEQKKKSNNNKRYQIEKLSFNYAKVASCYGIQQDSQNLIIFPEKSFSWVESNFMKLQKIFLSAETEKSFWNQKCKVPCDRLLRSWIEKIES